MTTYSETDPRQRAGGRDAHGGYAPPYGPLDAVLGYALFYVVVDRATPTVVDVMGDVLTGVSAGSIRLALAVGLWFVLVMTLLDQLRRQLAALGVGSHEAVDADPASRSPPSEPAALAYLALFALAGTLAWLTFERGIAAAVALVPAVARLDVGAFVFGDALTLVVFFLAYAATTWTLDRLVVGGLRWVLRDASAPRSQTV